METQALWTQDLTDQEKEDLLVKLEAQIRKRRLEVPAMMLLEMHLPVSRILGNAMVVFTPFLAPFVGIDNVHNYSRLMMERQNIEKLIDRLTEEPTTATEEQSP